MNTQDSQQNSKDPFKNPKDQKPIRKDPPLSSPNEPTRAFPSEPSSTYSSDPSQYATGTEKPLPKEPVGAGALGSDKTRIKIETKRGPDEPGRQTADSGNKGAGAGKTCCSISSYAASDQEKMIAYILLAVGLLTLLFVDNLFGGLIIGAVAGYYFSAEIINYLRNLAQLGGIQNQLRYIVLAAVLLGLIIAAPGIFIGAIVVAAFKQVLMGPKG